jgi:predicted adenylyl cyclase CyaB
MYEVELRARFDQKTHERLKAFLEKHAESLGVDDKDAYYYIYPDRLLKLVNNISKGTAKISLKLNKIGQGASFSEHELEFSEAQFGTAKFILDNLGLPTTKVMHGPQQRVNYRYKGAELALKWSEAWGYHLELEQLVETEAETPAAEAKLRELAQELGVEIMSDEELREFTQSAE